MRFFLCCAAVSVVSCGALDPSSWRTAVVGSWTVTAFTGTERCNGETTTSNTVGAANTLLIQTGLIGEKSITGTFAGLEILKGTMTGPDEFSVDYTMYSTTSGSGSTYCAYSIYWTSGMGKLDADKRLAIDMVGEKKAFCVTPPDQSCTSQARFTAVKN